jgi:hypothetical protein
MAHLGRHATKPHRPGREAPESQAQGGSRRARAGWPPEGQGRLVVGVGSGEPDKGDGDTPAVPSPDPVGLGDAPDVAPTGGVADWDGVGE